MAVLSRLRKAVNAFRQYEETFSAYGSNLGPSSQGVTPSFRVFGVTNERSIVTSIYNRIAIDAASVNVKHIAVDEYDRYVDVVKSKLNLCLNFEANLDQAPRHFRQDIVSVMIDRGVAAIVPVDTVTDSKGNSEILTLRVGEITQWYAHHVRVNLWNEDLGIKQEITIEKTKVAIVENPLYSVMNGPNSTLQRLVRKLSLLDNVDETSAGKLDMIIQLPYTIKTEARREQAEGRRKALEVQLKDSQYGIAYADGSEKITQLNRPVENSLLKQVEYLTGLLHTQLGITAGVMDGTADEAAMLNYENRTIIPILDSVVEAMIRAFIGETKYMKGERIRYFRDPFKLVPVKDLAEISDKLARNEILSANEIRGFMGIIPSTDPRADKLLNSNMAPNPEAIAALPEGTLINPDGTVDQGVDIENDDLMQSAFDEIDGTIDDIFNDLGVEP